MPIYDQSFRRYQGARQFKALWWPVAEYTLRPMLKSKLVYVFAAVLLIYVTVITLGMLAATMMDSLAPAQQAAQAREQLQQQNIAVFGKGTTIGSILFYLISLCTGFVGFIGMAFGGGAISQDLRFNALPLYFSRPLRPAQYGAGKILGLALLPMGLLTIAIVITYLEGILFFHNALELLRQAGVLAKALLQAALMCAFMAVFFCGLSSVFRTAKVAAVVGLVLWVGTKGLGESIAALTGDRAWRAVSPGFCLDRIGRAMLQPDLPRRMGREMAGVELQWALLGLGLYAALALFFLWRKVRVVEIVR